MSEERFLLDRNALLKEMEKELQLLEGDMKAYNAYDSAVDTVASVLAEDAKIITHAHWEVLEKYDVYAGRKLKKSYCSHCKKPNRNYQPPFCPHCGADMDEKVGGEAE